MTRALPFLQSEELIHDISMAKKACAQYVELGAAYATFRQYLDSNIKQGGSLLTVYPRALQGGLIGCRHAYRPQHTSLVPLNSSLASCTLIYSSLFSSFLLWFLSLTIYVNGTANVR